MCTRFYPDIIVAVEVRDSLNWFSHVREELKAHVNIADEIIAETLRDVHIDVFGCVERQGQLKRTGICNVYIGYGKEEWKNEDYIRYLSSHPDLFKERDDGDFMYGLNADSIMHNVEYDGSDFDTYTMRVCQWMLTEKIYDPLILERLDLLKALPKDEPRDELTVSVA